MTRNSGVLLATGVVLGLPAVAEAHLVNTGLGPYYDGISHFVLTPEDGLLALALALLAGLRGARTSRLTLSLLPGSWFVGGLAGLAWPMVGTATVLTAASFLVLGGLVAADVRLRPMGVAGLALVLGLLHGNVNGSAMAEAKLGIVGLLGIVTALFAMVALAAAVVVVARASWARIAVRVAGSWIAATGLLMLGWYLRGT
jgi:hydrogenase/urease accessory protein HupE